MKRNKNFETEYQCPICGNEAPFKMRGDKPLVCKFCKQEYTKEERIAITRHKK